MSENINNPYAIKVFVNNEEKISKIVTAVGGDVSTSKSFTAPITVLGTPQSLTVDWANIGSPIDCQGYTMLLLYVKMSVNDSSKVRIRALGKTAEASADTYTFLTETITEAEIYVQKEFVEFAKDEDYTSIIRVRVNGVAFIQLQGQVGVLGTGTAASIDSIIENKI